VALAEWLDPALLEPPNNVQRVARGLVPLIVNLGEVRAYFVERLRRQAAITGDDDLAALVEELAGYPAPEHDSASQAALTAASEAAVRGILMPLRLRTPDGGELSLFGMVATFGTALEVTTSELSIESFFPADDATAEILRNLPRS
jgi:transcription regulator MmyB-like protein